MKTTSLRIAARLAVDNPADVMAGFKIYTSGIETELKQQGWEEQDEIPVDKEFFEIAGKYWVQDPEIHQRMIIEMAGARKKTDKKNNEVKEISPFMKRVGEFLSAKLGPKVIESVYQERLKECGYKVVKCEHIKEKGDKAWCGACGCGYRKDAELSTKLKMARVECPKLEGGFKKIDEVNEKHLLLL